MRAWWLGCLAGSLLGCLGELSEPVERPPAQSDAEDRTELLGAVHRDGRWLLSLLLTDSKGSPLELSSRSFSAFVDGAPVDLAVATLEQPGGDLLPEARPAPRVSVVVVLDEALSGHTVPVLRLLLLRLTRTGEVAVVRVAGDVSVTPFDHPDPSEALNASASGSGRRLLDGLDRAVAELATRDAPLRLVWLVAGGPDEGSTATEAAVQAAAVAGGVQIIASGTLDADPSQLSRLAVLSLYEPDSFSSGRALGAMADLLTGIWQVAAVATESDQVDLRVTSDRGTRELSFP